MKLSQSPPQLVHTLHGTKGECEVQFYLGIERHSFAGMGRILQSKRTTGRQLSTDKADTDDRSY